MMRRLLAVLVVLTTTLLATTMLAGPANAAKGRNDTNAKSCQKAGWQTVYTADGAAFASEKACTAHGAQGGTYSSVANFSTRCAQNGGTYSTNAVEDTCTWVGLEIDQLAPLVDAVFLPCRPPTYASSGFNLLQGVAFCGFA